MKDEILRGLLRRRLNEAQRMDMQKRESSLPSNRYWAASQIASQLGIPKIGYTLDPLEIAEMERCWEDFRVTVLEPLMAEEASLHPAKCCEGTPREHPCEMFRCHHGEIKGVSTQAKKMHLWDDFADRHYVPPAIGGSIEASLRS